MARIEPKMLLELWDQVKDFYSNSQLSGNFAKLAVHDHSNGRGVQIGSNGILAGAITRALVGTWLQTVRTSTANVTTSPAAVTVTWPVSFGDTNYTVTATPSYAATSGVVNWWIQARTATTATIYAVGSGTISNVSWHVVGTHD